MVSPEPKNSVQDGRLGKVNGVASLGQVLGAVLQGVPALARHS